MTLRPATEADLPKIETWLLDHIDTSMFPIENLRTHGFGSDHPRGLKVFLIERSDHFCGILALTNEGMLMPQAADATAEDWRDFARVLTGHPIIGVLGDPKQIRLGLRVLGLETRATTLDEDEPLMSLALDELLIPPTDGLELTPLDPEERPRLIRWRTHYNMALQGFSFDRAREQSPKDIDGYFERGSHRMLWDNGTPVSMTGFNAAQPEAVQIGGVYTPPAYRGRGYARTALALHLDEARRAGASRSILFASGDAARRAYAGIGFRLIGSYGLLLFEEPARL